MFRVRGKSNTIYFRRRVPKEFASVHPKPFFEVCLKTDSMAEAKEKAAAVWAGCLAGWQDRLDGRAADAEKRFEAVRRIARARGFQYRRMQEIVQGPVSAILERLSAVPVLPAGSVDPVVAAALVGSIDPPVMTVSRALEKYWDFSKAKLIGKTEDQKRRWENPKKKAVANFIKVCGDLPLADIRPDEMQDFQDWWVERLELEGLSANSANKDFGHLSTILTTVCRKMRLGITPPVKGWTIQEGRANERPPFSDRWIRDRLIPHFTSDACTLNDEARDVLLIMINTGARPSEISGLSPADSVIEPGAVPYIDINDQGRTLKTDASVRRVPLVGVSLEAARRAVGRGFPRYAGSPSLSALVNKYLLTHGLKETPGHVFYSLRHSFEDRLLAAGVDERVRRDLIGHSLGGRQRYGSGLSLAATHEILQGLAL